jgi:hypothetical protein
MAHEAGKGDTQRPTNYETFSEQMKKIFGDNKCPKCGKQIFSTHEHKCEEKPE